MRSKIFITGASGFVGKNLIEYLKPKYSFTKYNRKEKIDIIESLVIHLAGKAHDLKNISNSEEYYQANTELTKKVFDEFINSDAKIFITLSSVKAVADELVGELTEEYMPKPITHYGKSKLLAEQYITNKEIPSGKRIYVLRPCMIHGPCNKGNLILLFNIVKSNLPWPLGLYENKRSFCSIDNLCFIIQELIENDHIPSGVYNIADDEPLSTNEVIKLMANSLDKPFRIWNFPKILINTFANIGDIFNLPLNGERLKKLTESYIVNNSKIKSVIKKPLPLSSREGLMKTLKSFNSDAE